jgi:hypothetical protein
VREDRTRATLTARVFADDVTGTGTVTFRFRRQVLATRTLDEDGEASVRLPTFGRTGNKEIRVRYSGDDHLEAATTVHVVRVVR